MELIRALSCQAENEWKIVLKRRTGAGISPAAVPNLFHFFFCLYFFRLLHLQPILKGLPGNTNHVPNADDFERPRFCQFIGWWTSDTKDGSYIIYSIGPILSQVSLSATRNHWKSSDKHCAKLGTILLSASGISPLFCIIHKILHCPVLCRPFQWNYGRYVQKAKYCQLYARTQWKSDHLF